MKSKTPALVFIIVGFVLTMISWITSMIAYDIYILFIVLMIFSIITFVFGLLSLKDDQKSIVIGILLIIFCGVIGGVLYLVWDPQLNYNNEESKATFDEFSKDYLKYLEEQGIMDSEDDKKSKTEDPYSQLKKLKELLDQGIIDKATYDEKAKKYIDML